MRAHQAESQQLAPGWQARSLNEAFALTVAACSNDVALRGGDGSLVLTYGEYASQAGQVALGLKRRGVRRHDTVALMLTNRIEFHVVDSAVNLLGATTVSIYNTSSPDQVRYILRHSQARLLISESQFLQRLSPSLPSGITTINVDYGLDELGDDDWFDWEEAVHRSGPDDVVTLVYTSGTTGRPKAVQITNGNVMAVGRSTEWFARRGGSVVSYFPMAHMAERLMTHYLPRRCGWTVTCCPEPGAVLSTVREVHPTAFFGVPRIYQKLRSAVLAEIDACDEPARRHAKDALAVRIAWVKEACSGTPSPGLISQAEDADVRVMASLRARFGFDRIGWATTGAAPIPRDLHEFVYAFGLPLSEVWGSTETSGLATACPTGQIRIGTVGRAVDGIELRVESDGEIAVQGPLVTSGYRHAPEKNAEAFTPDGWFLTGDLGELSPDGWLRITGRKKDLIITSAGKNIAPALLESRVQAATPLIEHCVVIGEGRPFLTALVTLQPDARKRDRSQIHEDIASAINCANSEVSRVEQIKKFTIIDDIWWPGGQFTTSTMKPRRSAIIETYTSVIDAMYRRS